MKGKMACHLHVLAGMSMFSSTFDLWFIKTLKTRRADNTKSANSAQSPTRQAESFLIAEVDGAWIGQSLRQY